MHGSCYKLIYLMLVTYFYQDFFNLVRTLRCIMFIIILDTLYTRYQSPSLTVNLEEIFRFLGDGLLYKQLFQRDSQINDILICSYKSCSSAGNVGIVTAT